MAVGKTYSYIAAVFKAVKTDIHRCVGSTSTWFKEMKVFFSDCESHRSYRRKVLIAGCYSQVISLQQLAVCHVCLLSSMQCKPSPFCFAAHPRTPVMGYVWEKPLSFSHAAGVWARMGKVVDQGRHGVWEDVMELSVTAFLLRLSGLRGTINSWPGAASTCSS